MDRNELNRLRPLRREIVCRIKELHKMEQREISAAKQGQSLMHSMTKIALAEDHHEQKAALRSEVFYLQKKFLMERSTLEEQISKEPNAYIRLVLSLYYVDLLDMKNIANFIGGKCTAGAVQALLSRYFNGLPTTERIDSS